jgi:predicted lipid carrier protein YhbT
MDAVAFPITLARGMMRLMPPPMVERGAGMLLRRMGRNHPALFRNLAELAPKSIRVEPTDIPHRFELRFGGGPPQLTLARRGGAPVDAVLKGSLEALLALLEGRIDADTLFFTRAISIVGDTSAVVALHNTLDRESINLLDEATSLLGPFRRAGRTAVLNWERRVGRLRARFGAVRAAVPDRSDVVAERDRLLAENAALASRLAKLQVRQRRKEGAGA